MGQQTVNRGEFGKRVHGFTRTGQKQDKTLRKVNLGHLFIKKNSEQVNINEG
jgi:hypothetical protein